VGWCGRGSIGGGRGGVLGGGAGRSDWGLMCCRHLPGQGNFLQQSGLASALLRLLLPLSSPPPQHTQHPHTKLTDTHPVSLYTHTRRFSKAGFVTIPDHAKWRYLVSADGCVAQTRLVKVGRVGSRGEGAALAQCCWRRGLGQFKSKQHSLGRCAWLECFINNPKTGELGAVPGTAVGRPNHGQ
jgi:hypothetical protein